MQPPWLLPRHLPKQCLLNTPYEIVLGVFISFFLFRSIDGQTQTYCKISRVAAFMFSHRHRLFLLQQNLITND